MSQRQIDAQRALELSTRNTNPEKYGPTPTNTDWSSATDSHSASLAASNESPFVWTGAKNTALAVQVSKKNSLPRKSSIDITNWLITLGTEKTNMNESNSGRKRTRSPSPSTGRSYKNHCTRYIPPTPGGSIESTTPINVEPTTPVGSNIGSKNESLHKGNSHPPHNTETLNVTGTLDNSSTTSTPITSANEGNTHPPSSTETPNVSYISDRSIITSTPVKERKTCNNNNNEKPSPNETLENLLTLADISAKDNDMHISNSLSKTMDVDLNDTISFKNRLKDYLLISEQTETSEPFSTFSLIYTG